MTESDRELGMHRKITRRDFVYNVAGGAAALSLAGCGSEPPLAARKPGPVGYGRASVPAADAYPPIRAGLRGSHEGSYGTAHALAREGETDWGSVNEPDETTYDLVVVGGGVSGLSAAYFFREQYPDARILILDNHDDFGGHAKRNEFQVGDRTILGYGGSQSIDTPGEYSDVAIGLLRKLAVDVEKFNDSFYDHDFYRRNDLTGAVYFDRDTFGSDKLVPFSIINPQRLLPLAPTGVGLEQSVNQMPISEEAKRQIIRLNTMSDDTLTDYSIFSEAGYLGTISYRDFLTKHIGITDENVLRIYQDATTPLWALGIDAVPALDAMGFGLPGLRATGTGTFKGLVEKMIDWTVEPYTYHFPDGNASVARLLVRALVPDAAAGNTMEDIVPAQFDYSRLDVDGAPTRIRLNSTVIHAEHRDGGNKGDVRVTYVRDGATRNVSAKQCVLACYGVMIPHLCPDLPEKQREALSSQIKAPNIYTNVLLRNWHALKKQRLGVAHCPGSWHSLVLTDFPVSMGDYRFADDPDDPIMLSLHAALTAPGLEPRDQWRAGRHELLATDFETIERSIRGQISGMLSPAGFDPAEDILGIAVNRHAHGYAYEYIPMFDPDYGEGEAPHEIGRQKFGSITIANSDAGASAYLDSAIDEAWRAVNELNG